MIVVVSDTSPMRALNHLGLLKSLDKLFDQLLVPPSVLYELTFPPTRFDVVDVSRYDFVHIRAPKDDAQVEFFLRSLNSGESEALALALEVGPHALLIDELAGRAVAERHGIPILGTLGVLLRAKSIGLVSLVDPLLERLSNEMSFFMSDQLRKDILRIAGESPNN